MKLYYPNEAKNENEATPLGNGHIGLWTYRGVLSEKMHLNESTFWAGYPEGDYEDTEDYRKVFKKAQRLAAKGKYRRAMWALQEKPSTFNSRSYQPIGDLLLSFEKDCLTKGAQVDLENGVVSVFTSLYTRSTFVSHEDNVFCIRIEAEKPIDMRFALQSPHPSQIDYDGRYYMTGNAPSFFREKIPVYKDKGMAYCVAVSFDTNALVKSKKDLTFLQFTYLTITGTITTGFKAWNEMPETDTFVVKRKADVLLNKALEKPFDVLFKHHKFDFATRMGQNDFVMGKEESIVEIEKELRAPSVSTALVNAYYAFGKYLTVSSSRADSLATNLQGIWNKDLCPAWRSNYTVNINTQMNYWLPDTVNLPESFTPFVNLVKTLSESGEKTAKELLGCDGFCVFHNTDIWGFSRPVTGNFRHSFFPLAGHWLTTQLFEHYRYTLDKKYLADIYPILKKACDFALSFLVEQKNELVTAPSTSPEHTYKGGRSITRASTVDMFILQELFQDTVEAASVLQIDDEFVQTVREAKDKLHKPAVQKDGRLCEFYDDVQESDKGHRHFSHLIGLFPYQQIGYYNRTEYLDAAAKSLAYRLDNGSGYTGWSCAWALNLLTKIHNGERFNEYLVKLFHDSTYPNLFDKHPPFQIDGNFGAARALAGMVAISEDNVIEFFPVKTKWNKDGRVRNLCLQGGYKISMEWKNYRPYFLSVYSETNYVSYRSPIDGTIETYVVTPRKHVVLI